MGRPTEEWCLCDTHVNDDNDSDTSSHSLSTCAAARGDFFLDINSLRYKVKCATVFNSISQNWVWRVREISDLSTVIQLQRRGKTSAPGLSEAHVTIPAPGQSCCPGNLWKELQMEYSSSDLGPPSSSYLPIEHAQGEKYVNPGSHSCLFLT